MRATGRWCLPTGAPQLSGRQRADHRFEGDTEPLPSRAAFAPSVSEYAPRSSVLRLALYGIGIGVSVGLLARYVQRRRSISVSLQKEPPSAVPVPDAPRPIPAPSHPGRAQILAGCQPHLNEGSTVVPNIAVTARYNMAAVRLKVRFWVNGDGFVTRAFVDGF